MTKQLKTKFPVIDSRADLMKATRSLSLGKPTSSFRGTYVPTGEEFVYQNGELIEYVDRAQLNKLTEEEREQIE